MDCGLEGGGVLTPISTDGDLDLFASMITSAELPPPPPIASGSGTSNNHLPMSQPPITLDFLDSRDVQYLSSATSTLDMYCAYLSIISDSYDVEF